VQGRGGDFGLLLLRKWVIFSLPWAGNGRTNMRLLCGIAVYFSAAGGAKMPAQSQNCKTLIISSL